LGGAMVGDERGRSGFSGVELYRGVGPELMAVRKCDVVSMFFTIEGNHP